jgi:cob(I)alamin adenosyltransferase
MSKGLIHIYCGDGKGKTTAAIGLAVRAAGNGKRVLFVQFLKNGKTGEVEFFKTVGNIDVLRSGCSAKFTRDMTADEKKQTYKNNMGCFYNTVQESEAYDLLIFDEMCAAYNLGLIDKRQILDFLKNKPESLEVVLTGRDPAPELLQLADYISKIEKIRHPYDKGIKARKGIER